MSGWFDGLMGGVASISQAPTRLYNLYGNSYIKPAVRQILFYQGAFYFSATTMAYFHQWMFDPDNQHINSADDSMGYQIAETMSSLFSNGLMLCAVYGVPLTYNLLIEMVNSDKNDNYHARKQVPCEHTSHKGMLANQSLYFLGARLPFLITSSLSPAFSTSNLIAQLLNATVLITQNEYNRKRFKKLCPKIAYDDLNQSSTFIVGEALGYFTVSQLTSLTTPQLLDSILQELLYYAVSTSILYREEDSTEYKDIKLHPIKYSELSIEQVKQLINQIKDWWGKNKKPGTFLKSFTEQFFVFLKKLVPYIPLKATLLNFPLHQFAGVIKKLLDASRSALVTTLSRTGALGVLTEIARIGINTLDYAWKPQDPTKKFVLNQVAIPSSVDFVEAVHQHLENYEQYKIEDGDPILTWLSGADTEAPTQPPSVVFSHQHKTNQQLTQTPYNMS
ncbi:hypothetical protein L3V86_07235 [Thiotrichales bacterium 19S11-10]|nr:hypothetical protein [Thiotrichales bacterium 19S11-10]